MKKTSLFLFLSVLYIGCSTNDISEEETQQEIIENLTISITIEGNLENREQTLYISSEEGVIVGQLSLKNNQGNSLTVQRDPDTRYFVIIHNKLTYNELTSHYFNIYENMKSSNYVIKANGNNNHASEDLPNVDLFLSNTGNIKRVGMTGGGYSRMSTANGGTFESNGTCLSKPGDYYSSFKEQDEPFARFFWLENVEEDISFTHDYRELPIANLVATQLPEHESGTIFVSGVRSEHPSATHTLSYGGTQGLQTFDSYIPEYPIFDYTFFSASLFNGTTSYSFFAVAEEIPSSIQLPSFDFAINEFTLKSTVFSTTGDYKISNANFLISENDHIQAIVKVFSEPNEKVTFSINTLINSLFEKFPSLDAAELEPNRITLSSDNYRKNYHEFVKGLIEENRSKLPGNILKTISRKGN